MVDVDRRRLSVYALAAFAAGSSSTASSYGSLRVFLGAHLLAALPGAVFAAGARGRGRGVSGTQRFLLPLSRHGDLRSESGSSSSAASASSFAAASSSDAPGVPVRRRGQLQHGNLGSDP